MARKLRPLLQVSGYRIITVTGTDSLTSLIRAEGPALILVIAGKGDGAPVGLCQQIAASITADFTPVLVITDRETANRQADFVAGGVAEVLAYPIDSDLLLTRIHAHLHIKAQFDAVRRQNAELTAELLERNQQLEAALDVLQETDLIRTTLVHSVGHELRTPLLQVKSAIALLREPPSPGTSNDVLTEMAMQAVGRLESIIINITQLADSQNLKPEPFVLNDSINLAIRNLERLWKPHDTRRIDRGDGKALPLIIGDKRGVAQVLQHLLDNALKFSEGQGPVEILVQPRANQVEIAVRDYGIGIPADKLDSIFLAFYQVDSSSTRKFGGVGVGLTLAQIIAQKMNSQIRVRSKVNQGSTFTFTLPIARL